MCYPETCSKCGLTSWGGCGKHVPGVYNNIPSKDKVCLCKAWPGVELPPEMAAKIPAEVKAAEGASQVRTCVLL